MKNGKYTKRSGVATKTLVLALAVMLIVGCTIGGTLAWLSVQTAPVVNTFTVGDINIELTETWNAKSQGSSTNDIWTGKLVPGSTLTKDPKVIVNANSEACWLFVKVEKSANLDNFVTYSIDNGWTALTGVTGVYYRTVNASTSDQEFAVLAGNTVTVKSTVTKGMLTADDFSAPTLTFTAYAVQKDNVSTAAEAWAIATAS